MKKEILVEISGKNWHQIISVCGGLYIEKYYNESFNPKPYCLEFNKYKYWYRDKKERDRDFEKIIKAKNKLISGGSMDTIKNYFKKHEDTLLTLGLLLILDEYIFEGKFREKIKDLVDGFINKTKRNLELEDKKDD